MLVEIVSPDGKILAVPHWIRNDLRKLGLLQWNREAWLWQISKDYKAFYLLLQSGRGKPAPVRASDPGRIRIYPKKGGKVAPLVKYLGADGNGPSHAEVVEVRRQAFRHHCDLSRGKTRSSSKICRCWMPRDEKSRVETDHES